MGHPRQGSKVELLVIQPTSFCNLDCCYCYVPDRANKARMAKATLERTVDLLLAEADRLGPELEVLWHAGEPLAAGLAFYEDATLILARLAETCRVTQTFQTNGTLISDAWCAFFKRVEARVGVSLDGPPEVHDAVRRTRRGGGSFVDTMRGVRHLQFADLPVSALAVVTPGSLGRAREIFEFFLAEGILRVGFNVEEVEGENLCSALVQTQTDIEARYRAFLQEIIALNQARGSPVAIREVQAMVQSFAYRRRNPTAPPRPAETEIGRILTVGREGDVFTFSPELASGLKGRPKSFAIGNVHHATQLSDILESSRAEVLQGEIDVGIARCRTDCDYFGVCGGGSPANKIYENGSFASTSNIRCRLQIRVVADLLLDLVRKAPEAQTALAT